MVGIDAGIGRREAGDLSLEGGQMRSPDCSPRRAPVFPFWVGKRPDYPTITARGRVNWDAGMTSEPCFLAWLGGGCP